MATIDDVTTRNSAPDLGSVEQGSFLAIAENLSLLFGLIAQEAQRRDAAVRQRAPETRQDRVAMMGVYAG